MNNQIKPPVLGPAADWATAEHRNHRELPLKSRAAILIVWRAAAALNAKFLLRDDDDSDATIAGDVFIESQPDLPRAADAQPTDDDPPSDAQRAAGMPSAAVSIAPASTAGPDAVVNGAGKGSVAAQQSSGDDAASWHLRVVAAGAPKSANEVRPDPHPRVVRLKASSKLSPVASGRSGVALATTLFAAIAVCCLLGFMLRYVDEPASSLSTNAVSYEGTGHATKRPHGRQKVNASESRRDQQR